MILPLALKVLRQIELLTGHDAHGMTNFQFDAIISRHLPHTHELVHMLYNFAQEDLPLFTLPVLQEGLACCLGGRWGKSPDVINYWGNVSVTFARPGGKISAWAQTAGAPGVGFVCSGCTQHARPRGPAGAIAR